jgi:hypothetical protein
VLVVLVCLFELTLPKRKSKNKERTNGKENKIEEFEEYKFEE